MATTTKRSNKEVEVESKKLKNDEIINLNDPELVASFDFSQIKCELVVNATQNKYGHPVKILYRGRPLSISVILKKDDVVQLCSGYGVSKLDSAKFNDEDNGNSSESYSMGINLYDENRCEPDALHTTIIDFLEKLRQRVVDYCKETDILKKTGVALNKVESNIPSFYTFYKEDNLEMPEHYKKRIYFKAAAYPKNVAKAKKKLTEVVDPEEIQKILIDAINTKFQNVEEFNTIKIEVGGQMYKKKEYISVPMIDQNFDSVLTGRKNILKVTWNVSLFQAKKVCHLRNQLVQVLFKDVAQRDNSFDDIEPLNGQDSDAEGKIEYESD